MRERRKHPETMIRQGLCPICEHSFLDSHVAEKGGDFPGFAAGSAPKRVYCTVVVDGEKCPCDVDVMAALGLTGPGIRP